MGDQEDEEIQRIRAEQNEMGQQARPPPPRPAPPRPPRCVHREIVTGANNTAPPTQLALVKFLQNAVKFKEAKINGLNDELQGMADVARGEVQVLEAAHEVGTQGQGISQSDPRNLATAHRQLAPGAVWRCARPLRNFAKASGCQRAGARPDCLGRRSRDFSRIKKETRSGPRWRSMTSSTRCAC